jgi:hypothetical protein
MRWHLVNGDRAGQSELSGPSTDLTNAVTNRLTGSGLLYDITEAL